MSVHGRGSAAGLPGKAGRRLTAYHPETRAATVAAVLIRDVITPGQRIKTAEGYLQVPAVFARAGIQDYLAGQVGMDDRAPDAVVKVYRSPEEVFTDESMRSFGLRPVTNNHPAGLVDAASVGQFQVGMSLPNVTRDGDLLRGDLIIMDAKAVREIEGGKVQLSGGYEAEYVIGAGKTPGGEHFDAEQKNIRGNHIALVDKGRCGTACSIADSVDCGDCDNCPKAGKGDTVKVKIKGVDHEMGETAGQAVAVLVADSETLLQRVADAEEAKTKAEEEKDEFEKKKEKAEGEKDAAMALVADASDTATLDARAEARAAVLTTARRLHPKVVTDGQSNEDIRRSVVSELTTMDAAVLKEKGDPYIEARFDGLAEGGGESKRFADRNLPHTKDGVDPTADTAVVARRKATTDLEDAWKTGSQAAPAA